MRVMIQLLVVGSVSLSAQTTCNNTPAYTPCEIAFDVAGAEARANPDPYSTVAVQAEFRSPRFRTFLMPAYWDGRQMVLRFTPTEAGEWIYRITSSLASLDGKQGHFTAAASEAPGFVHVANVHHWQTDDKQAHLWIGDIADRFAFLSPEEAQNKLAATVQNKFTHLRLSILGGGADRARVFNGARPNAAYFAELDRRILEVNRKGIVADLVLASDPAYVTALLPGWAERERFVRYLAARYAPMNVTWQGLGEFEDFQGGRALLKELGLAIKKHDPYQHPRSSNARITSSPLLGDGWMDYVISRSLSAEDDAMGAVEHQLYPAPFIGVTSAKRLWNTTMNGQYPMFEGSQEKEARYWFEFISDSRHWEMEPFFGVDGARAVALDGVEYIVYVDRSGPIEVETEKHGYDVRWFNPLTGEAIDEKKKYHGEHFTGERPDSAHPWVLLVSREGRKESMLRSYKFESRLLLMQEVESATGVVPFDMVAPTGDILDTTTPVAYSVKIKRDTRATRAMVYLWTGEVAADGQGLRVLGAGPKGTFRIPETIAANYPAVFSLRVTALNANGKAYAADRVFQVNK